MNPEKFDLSKLRIASPCSVAWNNMTGDERMRFCDLCQLNVYNVAGMTEAEVRDLLSLAEGRLCMRLMKRADGTVITQDCPIGLAAYRKRVARFAGATMAAILGLFSISFGQNSRFYGRKEEPDVIDASKLKITHITNDCSGEITGTIKDQAGAVIPGAKIEVSGSDKEKEWAESNADGKYRVTHLRRGNYMLKISSPGFKTLTVENLKLSRVDCFAIDLVLKVGTITETVGVLAEQEIGTPIDLLKVGELPINTSGLTFRKQ